VRLCERLVLDLGSFGCVLFFRCFKNFVFPAATAKVLAAHLCVLGGAVPRGSAHPVTS